MGLERRQRASVHSMLMHAVQFTVLVDYWYSDLDFSTPMCMHQRRGEEMREREGERGKRCDGLW